MEYIGLQYNALSWVFLQVRELSWLQWHPFSVSSSPLDGKHHIAVLIKVLGDWTEKLRGHISSVPEEEQGETDDLLHPNFTLKASIEGPYGHESPYHLTYMLSSIYIGYNMIEQVVVCLTCIRGL